jgi:hypothetical protein
MARLEIETITQVRGYRVYTYLEIGEIGVNSPAWCASLRGFPDGLAQPCRGTKILIPPLKRGARGDSDLETKSNQLVDTQ